MAVAPTQKSRATDKLGTLFAGLYPAAAESAAADPGRLEKVLTGIDPATQDACQVAAKRLEQPLDARQTGVLRLAQAVLAEFFAQPVFHPELGRALLSSCGPLLAGALSSDGWLLRREHAAGRLLLTLADFARGWSPALPEADEQCRVMQGWLQQVGEQGVDEAAGQAQTWYQDWLSRRDKITARVCQSESGAMRLRHARQLVARTLNNQLRDRELPDFMVASMDTWVSVFQWVLLNQGEQSPVWLRLTRSFALLVWSLQPAAAEEKARDKLNRVAAELKDALREVLGMAIANEAEREQLLEDIQVAHFCQQQGRALDWQEAPLVDGGSALDNAGASISRDLLAEVSAVNEGDWFVVMESGQRLQLLLKQDEHQQLLFVSQRGTREQTLSFEEFAWQFSTAAMSTLVQPTPMHDWVASRLEALAEKYRQAQRSRAQRAREEQAREARLREEREASWRKARAEAEQLEASQGLVAEQPEDSESTSADTLSVGQQRREDAAAKHGATPEHRRKRARLLVSSLTMGAWLDFHDAEQDDAPAMRRKLAVVLPSSGKYIFVDDFGGEKYQLARQELIAGIAEGNITVVRKDARFDDALSRIMESGAA